MTDQQQAMPPVEPLDDYPNIELRPSIGWAAHCRACNYNLTQDMTEFAFWSERDGAENDATHADAELGDCPECKALLGKPVCDECGEETSRVGQLCGECVDEAEPATMTGMPDAAWKAEV